MRQRNAERTERAEQARQAETEYHRQIMAPHDGDALQRFLHALQNTTPRREPVRIDDSPENDLRYLTAAYSAIVEANGRSFINDEFTAKTLSDTSRWLSGNGKPGLILSGNVGVGKTTLTQAVAKVLFIREGKKMPIWEAKRITTLGRGDSGEKVLADLCKTNLLGVDDLGVESVTVKNFGNESNPMIDLLSERYNKRMFTLITTNLTSEDICERYGVRIADRINELCNKISYDYRQKSYRH